MPENNNGQVLQLIADTVKRNSDDISDIKQAMNQLVRLDQQMINHQDGMARLGNKIDTIDVRQGDILDRLQRLETLEKTRTGVVTWLTGIISSVLTAGIILYFFDKGPK